MKELMESAGILYVSALNVHVEPCVMKLREKAAAMRMP